MEFYIKYLIIFVFSIISEVAYSQAILEVKNNSYRLMTLKVIEIDGLDGALYKAVYISPYGSETINFIVDVFSQKPKQSFRVIHLYMKKINPFKL